MRIVFLCSGGGGNLKFVVHAIDQGWLADAQVCAVLSDRECEANVFARAHGLASEVLDFSPSGQCAVLDRLQALAADVVVTTVHRVLVPELVQAFRGRLLNLHYSLLPAFAATIGVLPLHQALAYGAKFVGITVHQVDEGVDTGRPVVQALTAVPPAAEPAVLMNVLFRAGCIGLLHAIESLRPTVLAERGDARTSMMLSGQLVHVNPPLRVPAALEHEHGWAFLA